MGDKAAPLDRVNETRWRLLLPAQDHVRRRKLVKRRVYFYRRKLSSVEFKMPTFGNVPWIKTFFPAFVRPSAGPDVYVGHLPSSSCLYNRFTSYVSRITRQVSRFCR